MAKANFDLQARKWDILLAGLTLLIMLLTTLTAFSQGGGKLTLKGKISFPDQKVRVSITSKHNGRTTSDEDGFFTILIVQLPDTLTFFAVGYKTTYYPIISVKKAISVNMVAEAVDLGMVEINTGYQRLKPNETNGTVAVINSSQINARGGANILERLLGQSSGLLLNVGKSNDNVQNKTGLSIRGPGTFNGPLDPLIVLDGFIYEGSIDNINPNDIEQVSILKDASAASIWGARAGNGVIVMTSKKGKLNQKMSIDAAASFLVKELPNLFSLPQMSSSDYIDAERLMFNKGYFDSRIINTPYLSLTPVVELLLKNKRSLINATSLDASLNALKAIDARQSYLDEFYTHAKTSQFNLGIKGGSDHYSYLISTGYEEQVGETFASSKKVNVNLAQEAKITNRLSLSSKVYYTNTSQESGRLTYNSVKIGSRTIPYLAFRDEHGQPVPIATAYRSAYTDTLAKGKLLDWKYYPAEDYNQSKTRSTTNELFATATLQYKILDFINASLSYQYQKQTTPSETISDIDSYFSRNLINTYSQYNRSTNLISYIVPRGGISQWSENTQSSHTLRGQLGVDKGFGNHRINAIAGAEIREVNAKGNASTRYGYQADPLSFVDIDPVNAYKSIITGNADKIGTGIQLTSNTYRFVSNYANAAYTYMDRYTLSGSIRMDGSNIFGASTNDKWKPLWSAGLGWDLSKESFYKVDWLPGLRIKTTYGYSGNVDLTKTALSVGVVSTSPLTGNPFTRITSINNPSLRWEQLSQLSLSVDFGFRGNRLNGSVAIFRKRGSDLYGAALYDYTTWGASNLLTRNVADMSGRGVEFDLHALNIKSASFSWNTDSYFNYNDSRTLKYYNQSGPGLYSLIGASNTIAPIVGKPLYSMVAYQWAGLDSKGNPQGYLKGSPSTDYDAIAAEALATGDNLRYIGSASPLFYGSLINTFRWKALSLSINLSYKLGYYGLRQSFSSTAFIENGIGNSDYEKRWQNAGDERYTNVPAFVYPANSARDGFYEQAEINTIKADHIKLDYISFAYKWKLKTEKLNFHSVELYAGLQNLGIIWRANKLHLDPEYLNGLPPSMAMLIGLRTGL